MFYGKGFTQALRETAKLEEEGLIIGFPVPPPKRYGVIGFDKNMNVLGIEKKPKVPKSKYAVPGLYFYDNDVVSVTENLNPSRRGELEITDVNNIYLGRGKLRVELLSRGMAWLDTGTHEALQLASSYIHAIQNRMGLMVGCIEEIAFECG